MANPLPADNVSPAQVAYYAKVRPVLEAQITAAVNSAVEAGAADPLAHVARQLQRSSANPYADQPFGALCSAIGKCVPPRPS